MEITGSNIMLITAIISLLVQGTTIEKMAGWLNLKSPLGEVLK